MQMTNRSRRLLAMMTLAMGGAMLGGASDADAAFVLSIDDLGTGGVDAIIVDNALSGTATTKGLSSVADMSGALGAIGFSGSVGPFMVFATTALSKPLMGTPGPEIYVTATVFSTGAGTLEIMATDTDFVLSNDKLKLTNTIGGTTGGTVTALPGSLDQGNGEFAMGAGPLHSTATLGPLGPGAFSGSTSTLVPPLAAAFSLTQTIRIVHTGAGQVTFVNNDLAAVNPEPASFLVFGVGLACMGLARRRKRKRPA